MATRATRRYSGRPSLTSLAKTVFIVLGLVVLGFFAVAAGERSRPLPDASSDLAPAASQVSNSNASSATANPQSGGIAKPPTPSAAQRDFDYFPDHYVNHATKIEDPVPTF